MTRALIDGDIILYSCGFAANDEDVSHALHNAKKMISDIVDKTHSDDYEIFLTGKNNYRVEVATIAPYKGNRDSSHKPLHYQALKEYLINVHGAEVVEGREADDAMGCEQYMDWSDKPLGEEGTIICTIDKDLQMIPGWHYNWRKDELTFRELHEANKFFYTQLLTGDATDNIKGVPKIGPKKAEKILADCDGTDEIEMYMKVRRAYYEYVANLTPKLSHEDVLDLSYNMMEENAHLLWIQREEGVLWSLPHVEEEDERFASGD